MQDNTWIVWLVLLVAALALESLSMQLFSVWFALGAAAALLSCAFAAPVWLQMLLFVAVTVISLAATRPLMKKLQKKVQPSNADRSLGKTAEVLEEIDNLKGAGRIRVEGQIWSARMEEDRGVIPAGLTVETVAIQGNKILVRPLPENE